MATFKLGAIITDIAGSIGGTTLKRNGPYKVMMNKSSGSAYSSLLQNRALSYLGSIFKAWAFLDASVKEAWNNAALSFTFPDKFGTLRNLTGRQLFIKLNSQRYAYDSTVVDPFMLDSTLPPFLFKDAFKVPGANQLFLQIFCEDTSTITYSVMAEVSLNSLHAPTFVSRKVFTHVVFQGNGITDIYTPFVANFPYYKETYKARLYICQLNSSGFKSVIQHKDVRVGF